MPRKIRRKKQARKVISGLVKLKSTGLYSAKIDKRKKPTSYQKRLVRKHSDVISGRAVVLAPRNPKRFKDLFPTKKGLVIVPRRAGERLKVAKATGEIIGWRKVGGVAVKSSFEEISSKTRHTKDAAYLIPFIRGRKANGQPIYEWKRFPNWQSIEKVLSGYGYKNWKSFVVVEQIYKTDAAFEQSTIEEKHLTSRVSRDRDKSKGKPKRIHRRK